MPASLVSLGMLAAAIVGARTADARPLTDPMAYWSVQRRGANLAPTRVDPSLFSAAAAAGIQFVRLQPDSLPPAKRDFLIGNADGFETIPPSDLALLRQVLDVAEAHGVKVVLTMFSLPGCRKKNDVADRSDGRLWREEKYHDQALAFWRALAGALKGHPAIVAYNPLNEPHPDKEFGFDSPADPAFVKWLAGARGTAADVDRFNRRVVAAIREVDPHTPILLDGWFYADPGGFLHNEPVADARTLYAFHNLGPWEFAAFRINKGRYAYPARMPGAGRATRRWTFADLEAQVRPVEEFAARQGIDRRRIVASEFWCDRRIEGAAAYLSDEIRIYDARGWHWAFYAFRGAGSFTGLDYEIAPDAKLGARFWEAEAKGEDVEALKPRADNPLWHVLRRGLAGQ